MTVRGTVGLSPARYAVVVGFDYHARYLARVLNQHSARWEVEAFPGTRLGTVRALWALRRADVLIAFGGPGPSAALAEAAQIRRVPVLVVWAGSDVQLAAENPFELAVTKRRTFESVAVAPWLVDELEVLGIKAKVLSVAAIDVPEQIAPLPKTFRVLTYLPEPRRAFYGETHVYAVARELPDVQFTVLGPGAPNPTAPPNVVYAGYVEDVAQHLDASTVLLRLPQHDGTSVIVHEALAHARHVVWTHACPGVVTVPSAENAGAAVAKLYAAHQRGELEPNRIGREYVRRTFAPADIAARFEAHLESLVATRSVQRNGRRTHRVAISGLGLFSAEVAKHVERLRPDWRASVLSTNSRIEVLAALFMLTRSEVWYSIGSPFSDRWVSLLARILRKPRVVHWVGSDIETFRKVPRYRRHLPTTGIKHLAEVRWTADELSELGIATDIAPLPLRHTADGVKPLPEIFSILLYVPKTRPGFYGKYEYETILAEFAGEPLRVYIVGGGHLRAPAGVNVVNLGWRDDLRSIFDNVTVLIRLTPRDGLSLMVLEALSFGRYVLWSKPFPYATLVSGEDDVIAALRGMLQRHREGKLHAQYAAAEMIARRYSTEMAIDGILNAWEGVT